jgi:hypothetical protein
MSMRTKKSKTLAQRIHDIEKEAEAGLTRLSEKYRPPGVPGPTLRQMWVAKAGGNIFHAYQWACLEHGLK